MVKWILMALIGLLLAASASMAYAGAPGTKQGHDKRQPPSPPWMKR